MNLAIDIGNTLTHFGLYRTDKPVLRFSVPTHSKVNVREIHLKYLANYSARITHSAIASVAPSLTKTWMEYIKKYFKFMPVIVNNKSYLPIKVKVKNSDTLGADRIVNAAYGYMKFKEKENVVVCDLGTANTYDVVFKNGDFIGGIIAPGISTSAVALKQNTEKLPLLNIRDFRFNKSIIGKNTKEAIQSGLMNYPLYATEGIIKAIEKELKRKFEVIITGGPAKLIQKRLNIKSCYVENAVLDGLNMIINYQNSLK